MINCRGDFKTIGHILKDFWQRKSPKKQGNSHTLRNFHRACKIHGSFRMGCKTFAHLADINFLTLCEIFAEQNNNNNNNNKSHTL